MSVSVLIGYQDETDEYDGYVGTIACEEYHLLKSLAENINDRDTLSVDELNVLSDIKDHLARAYIQLYDAENKLSETQRTQVATISAAVGKTLDLFDHYRHKAPQLDFLLSFCIINAQSSEDFDTTTFTSVNTEDEYEDWPLLRESLEIGAIKYIEISDEFTNVIEDWNTLDGPRLVREAAASEDDPDAMETEIAWWRDNLDSLEADTEFILTTMLFRAVRNNLLKAKRTGKLVVISGEWPKRLEVF